MLNAASLAFSDILSPAFRGVLWKALTLTIVLLAVLWLALVWGLTSVVSTPWPWLDTSLDILAGAGLVVGMGFLVAPVAALFVGFFADDVAETVERTHYPGDSPGRPLPIGRSLATSLRFLLIVLLVNALALPLVLVLGFGALIFLVANAYLLGREYFELVALRHYDEETAHRLRLRHAGRIFAAGILVAAFMAVPIVNLLAPLFATAFMAHLEKWIAAEEQRRKASVPSP